MTPSKVDALLSALCTELGFCLPPGDNARLRENPPRSVELFVKAVFDAERLDAGENLRLSRQVRDMVLAHFRRWAELEETRGDEPEPKNQPA